MTTTPVKRSRGAPCLGIMLLILTCCHGAATIPAPTWRGIVPGVSTEAEVITLLGEPVQKEVFKDKTIYTYTHRYAVSHTHWPIYIVFRKGKVSLIRHTATTNHKLDWFLEQYGEPEKVTLCPGDFHGTRLFIFARHGVAVVGVHLEPPHQSDVVEEWYFVPTTSRQFLNQVAPPFVPKRTKGDAYPEDYWVRDEEDN